MKHTVIFERFDFSKRPALSESKTVSIEFPKVDDYNVEEFENLIWVELFKQKNTKPKGNFSSWLQKQ